MDPPGSGYRPTYCLILLSQELQLLSDLAALTMPGPLLFRSIGCFRVFCPGLLASTMRIRVPEAATSSVKEPDISKTWYWAPSEDASVLRSFCTALVGHRSSTAAPTSTLPHSIPTCGDKILKTRALAPPRHTRPKPIQN